MSQLRIRRLTSRNNITVQGEISGLWSEAKPKEITDIATAKKRLQSIMITSHRTEVRALGWRSLATDSVKSQFIDMKKSVHAPAEEALENISQKDS